MRILGFELRRVKPAAAPVEFLGHMAKIQIVDGDVCVLMADRALSQAQRDDMANYWRLIFGDRVTLVVIDDGMKLGVLSPPRAAEVHRQIQDGKVIANAIEAGK